MAKKNKVKKTLVEQILTKAKIEHVGLQINALEGILPEGIDRSTIFKTLALKGDKTGPVIGIIPITEHLSESALQLESMIVSAGEIGHSIQIKPQLLADFVQATFADILE